MLLQSLYLLRENAGYIKAASRSRCGADNQATRYICCKPLELLFLQLNHSLDIVLKSIRDNNHMRVCFLVYYKISFALLCVIQIAFWTP